jgi:hypothetical protein
MTYSFPRCRLIPAAHKAESAVPAKKTAGRPLYRMARKVFKPEY